MENASKALIMAAGVLIGIMILSLAVYLFATFGSTSAELHKQKETDQLNQFNSQFTSYEGKEDITIYDVITVANLATENNKYYEFDTRPTMPIKDEASDNYIWVGLSSRTYYNGWNKQLAYGKEVSSNTINQEYNKVINNDLKQIGTNQEYFANYGIDTNYLFRYTCKTYISSITGRVYKVTFTQK